MENGRQNNSKLWCQEIQIHTALTTEKNTSADTFQRFDGD